MKSAEANPTLGWLAALSVFYSALLAAILFGVALGAWEIMQTDFLLENPHRSKFAALALVLVTGPLIGLWFLIGYCFLALAFAMALAGYFIKRSGDFSLKILVAAFPLYWGLIYLQYNVLPNYNLYSDLPEHVDASRSAVAPATTGTAILLMTVITSWWCWRRKFAQSKS